MEILEPGVYDLPADAYHADPVPAERGGSLSVSGAKKLLPPSCPAIFKWDRENGQAPSAAFDFGHVAHTLVLGEGEPITVIDADDWRGKQAKEDAAHARGVGNVPVLRKDYERADAMAEAVHAHPIAGKLFTEGTAEQSAFWQDRETQVWRRARFDWLTTLTDGRPAIVDYKTTASAAPEAFASSVAKFGYHMQASWYIDALCELTDPADVPAFLFVAQEKTAPYVVSVFQLDTSDLALGDALNQQAIRTFVECASADRWPGYSDEIETLNLPGWYTRQHTTEPF